MLAAAGVLPAQSRVTSVKVAPIVDLGGVNGEAFRLELEYEPSATDAPRSLVAKFASRSPAALGVARFQRWYEREVRFYRELAPGTPIQVPRCYAAEIDAEDNYVLLLEDLAPREQGDQLAGCGIERAVQVVDAAAVLHGRWWDHSALAKHQWLPLTTVGLDHARGVQGAMRRGWQRAMTDGLLPTSLVRHGDAVIRAYPSLLERIAQPPLTVVHGDYRLDNLFFNGGDDPVHVIDWQFCCRARGIYDIGYFIGLSLAPEARAEQEQYLLNRYVQGLQDGDVSDYDLAACRDDYRVSLILGLAVFLIGAAGEQPNERMERVHESSIARLVRAIEENDALEVL